MAKKIHLISYRQEMRLSLTYKLIKASHRNQSQGNQIREELYIPTINKHYEVIDDDFVGGTMSAVLSRKHGIQIDLRKHL